MLAGNYHEMQVVRQTPLGYTLTLNDEEYFLHEAEATKPLAEGQAVKAFLYYDSKKRLTATMKEAKIAIEQYGWVKVVNVRPSLGVFVDIGINKEILIAPSDLPIFESLWPQVDDFVYCCLKESQQNYLFAVVAKPKDFEKEKQVAPQSLNGKKIRATVIRTGKIGTNIITDKGYMGFIHESERKEEPRLGEVIEGRVVRVKDDGEINVSLIPQKELAMVEDSDIILDYLQNHQGKMPFHDKSDPDDIRQTFKISKASFKRAIGKLMKEGKIYQEDGWTYLKETDMN